MIKIELGKMYKTSPQGQIVVAEEFITQTASGPGLEDNVSITYVYYQRLSEPHVFGHSWLKHAMNNWIEVGEEW